MHYIIIGVYCKYLAISIPKLDDWGPAHSQPVGLNQHHSMKFTSIPKVQMNGFPIGGAASQMPQLS